jgi:hypothetical protein
MIIEGKGSIQICIRMPNCDLWEACGANTFTAVKPGQLFKPTGPHMGMLPRPVGELLV